MTNTIRVKDYELLINQKPGILKNKKKRKKVNKFLSACKRNEKEEEWGEQ